MYRTVGILDLKLCISKVTPDGKVGLKLIKCIKTNQVTAIKIRKSSKFCKYGPWARVLGLDEPYPITLYDQKLVSWLRIYLNFKYNCFSGLKVHDVGKKQVSQNKLNMYIKSYVMCRKF